jgi:AraC-like DNA-binding protein
MPTLEPKIEYIDTLSQSAMVRHVYENDSVSVDWHSHPELEIVYICHGSGNAMVGDRIIDYQQGDLFAMGANVPHLFKGSSADKRYIIQCPAKLLEGGMFQYRDMDNLVEFVNKLAFGQLYRGGASKQLAALMEKMLEVSPDRAVPYLYLLLIEMSHIGGGEMLSSLPYSKNKNENTRISKILNHILENFSSDLNVENTASYLHMSKPAFCNYFKKKMGKRFSEFVNEVRINKACQMLRETDASVAEISYSVGYTNLSYFNRSFLKIKSCNPKQYRKL